MRAVASMADPRSGRYLIQPRAMTIRDILVARQKLMTLTARPTKSRKIGRNETRDKIASISQVFCFTATNA
jgi:hypothetical protein